MGLDFKQIFYSLAFLFVMLPAFADVIAPADILSCPAGSKPNVPDPTDPKVISYSCVQSSGGGSVEEDLLSAPMTKVVRGFVKTPKGIRVWTEIGMDDFAKRLFSDALGKFTSDLQSGLSKLNNESGRYTYEVNPSSLQLTSRLSIIGTNSGGEWHLDLASRSDLVLLTKTSPCGSQNVFEHLEASKNLSIERYSSGERGEKLSGHPEAAECLLKKGSGARPYVSGYACVDKQSGKKLEFVFKLPTSAASISNGGKDPVYLEFKVDGATVFWKRIAKNVSLQEDLFPLANSLRPKKIGTPISYALDAAFDCFDHLTWKEKTQPSQNTVGTADFTDPQVIHSEMRFVKFKELPDFKKENALNLKEIEKIEKKSALARPAAQAK